MTKEQILEKLKTDMESRGRNSRTIKWYTSVLRRFQDHYDKPADQMGETEIMEYQRYLINERCISKPSANKHNSALRFVYGVTLDRVMNYQKMPHCKYSRRIPQLFTREEICRIIGCAETLEHRVMFMLAYGSGLRISEVTNLKVSDIESNNMRILVRHGKGDRDRYVLLPQATLVALREYWLENRPKDWLFVSSTGGKYVNRTLSDAFKTALMWSCVSKHGTFHYFRHCYATHSYEDGVDLLTLKSLLGHSRIDTTAWYTQLANTQLRQARSPIDSLQLGSAQHLKRLPNA
jgi:site-specific recombinase XerD